MYEKTTCLLLRFLHTGMSSIVWIRNFTATYGATRITLGPLRDHQESIRPPWPHHNTLDFSKTYHSVKLMEEFLEWNHALYLLKGPYFWQTLGFFRWILLNFRDGIFIKFLLGPLGPLEVLYEYLSPKRTHQGLSKTPLGPIRPMGKISKGH